MKNLKSKTAKGRLINDLLLLRWASLLHFEFFGFSVLQFKIFPRLAQRLFPSRFVPHRDKFSFFPRLRRGMLFTFSFLLFTSSTPLPAQDSTRLSFFQPADTFHPTRFWVTVGGGAAIYSAASLGLYHAWYKGYELTGFHTFDDWGEWRHMDKAGHLFTAHMESSLAFKGALWTGMDRKAAAWTGAGVGMLLQTTIEVMDGFSAKWGFSWSDMAFNTLGSGLFLGQELAWQEQRIVMKTSYTEPRYPTAPILSVDGNHSTTLLARARELYGVSYPERFIKGYNGLTIWASVNPASFFPKERNPAFLPRWLNVAGGYGAGNLFGGFENRWEVDGVEFRLDDQLYPRYSRYYLSLDVDFTRIRTRSPVLKTLFSVVNWLKVPAPALEYNSLGRVRFHPFMW